VTLEAQLGRLPDAPGVYRFRNHERDVLYVGKAKSLRHRVRSYFHAAASHTPRIERMVAEVHEVEIIVVDTEIEALILEANLVKQEQPRYNVVLRDDKSFPYVRLSLQDTYPRAGLVRRAGLDGGFYVGPFLPASSARRTLKMVQRYFRVATCNEVFDGKRRPCLYYHLDQCLAPCAGKTEPEDYRRAVEDARLFLDGRHGELETSLARRMREASAAQDYEAAARLRDTLETVRGLAVRQSMASVGLEEQDYWAGHGTGGQVVLELFEMRRGRIRARREFALEGVDVEAGELYRTVLAQYYVEAEPPPDVHLPCRPAEPETLERWLSQRRGSRVRLRVPRRGAKRRLLELVRKNAALAFEARFRSEQTHGVAAVAALGELLGLDEPPQRIECFDVSNIQGTDGVAALVVWEGGKLRKSAYRTFTIRSVEGADDFASIAEAVGRRYRRLVAEGRALPDLVLIDGGRGQLGAAVAALTRVGLPMLPVAAIAKREEEIFVPGRAEPIRLERSAPALQLIQRLRDEAHRFALGRHRGRRARRTVRTELTDIPGIGPETSRKLLRRFGSAQGVRDASAAALREVVGPRAVAAILAHYRGRG
jgi:excinuclease ABC subunit C